MSSTANKTVAVWQALRPYQWTKNLLIFAALIFAEQLLIPAQALRGALAFAVFCALSSAVYVFNDIADAEADRAHPAKCRRPIASGALPIGAAWLLFAVLGATGLSAAYVLDLRFFVAALSYVGLMLVYSLGLKTLVILDALTIAVGFVIRALAGAVVLHVAFTNWLVVCTLFLALFLALGKRRNEADTAGPRAPAHRAVLAHYTPELLDAFLIITGSAALLSYAIYTCAPATIEKFQTDKLYLTLPFVVYGIFRYLYLIHTGKGDDPSRILLRDIPLALTVTGWGLACAGIIYAGRMP